MLAHGSGIDDIAFVALPILVFVALQWLNRRKVRQQSREQENGGAGPNESTGP